MPAYAALNASSLELAGVVLGAKVEAVNRAPFSAQVGVYCCMLSIALRLFL